MQDITKQMKDYLIERGYCHKEMRTETYACQPYNRETARYAKPRPDPEGTDTFTREYEETVVESLSHEELTQLFALEQNKELQQIKREFADFKKENEEKIFETHRDVRFLTVLTVVIVVLSLIGDILSSLN